MSLEELLVSLGLNLAANAIHEIIKKFAREGKEPTIENLQRYLSSHMNVDGAQIKAEKIIEFLAQHGNIVINSSSIHAARQVTMASNYGTVCVFGNNSTSTTNQTGIVAGQGAQIVMSGGGQRLFKPTTVLFAFSPKCALTRRSSGAAQTAAQPA